MTAAAPATDRAKAEYLFANLLQVAAIYYRELQDLHDWHEHGHAIGAGSSELGTVTTGSRNPDRQMVAAAMSSDRTAAYVARRLHAYEQRLRDMLHAMEVDLGRREPRPPKKGPGRGRILTSGTSNDDYGVAGNKAANRQQAPPEE